jgi:hypothetical protein
MHKKWDYKSPSFNGPDLGHMFPHRVISNTELNDWPYLRRDVPHNWYADSRMPWMGLVSTDEAALLFELARPFAGKPGLEIGCWRGWSTAHLASAGLVLDVIDPVLEDPACYGEIEGVMKALGAGQRVRLHPGKSPDLIARTHKARGEPWSFVFIDGDHEPPGPVLDAANVVHFLADESVVVFHDLASPHVAAGLGVLRGLGWNVIVFQTMQVMGAAWRGQALLPVHVADPQVNWEVPEHLKSYPISGEAEEVRAERLSDVLRGHAALLQDLADAAAERDRLRVELRQLEHVLALEADSASRLKAELSRARAERRATDAEWLRMKVETSRMTHAIARRRRGA